MKRRNFVVALTAASTVIMSTIKAISSSKKKVPEVGSKNSILEIKEGNKNIIYLKRGSIVKLPETPTPIQCIFHFSVAKYRFGKSPIILSNGQKIKGFPKEQIHVSKEISISKNPNFYLQYTGADIGWVILS